jgi:AAT family amino acid transporter
MEKENLKKSLSTRHITMLALGGAIGSGLFKGSGSAINLAGPSVLLSFLIGGLVLFIIMEGVGALVLKTKERGGLSALIGPYLGLRVANFIDWLYWLLWMIAVIAEASAAASFLQLWFPSVPAWIFVFGIAILTTGINLISVKLFAETEYWLALAKIAVIVILIGLGAFLIGKDIVHEGFFQMKTSVNIDTSVAD